MSALAINGGEKIFSEPARSLPARWPPAYPETAWQLADLYMNHKWSFYGPQELLFNEKFAAFTGTRQSVMMANGTVTLECAMRALEIGPGAEVIVPAHTWLATGSAVVSCGATPVVVDIEPDTLCLDPQAFESAITGRTRAVIPVHLLGSLADMDKICAIAAKHGLRVIEDCAHAHGGRWNGRHVGSIGDIGSFSFQESKLLACGEGGACITNDLHLGDILGRLSHIGYPLGSKQGVPADPPIMGLLCENYRVTDFQALILLSQLAHLEEDTRIRSEGAEYLRRQLDAIPGVRVQSPGRLATSQSYYCFVILIDHRQLKSGLTRANVLEALTAEGLTHVGIGWGAPMYKQRLWTIPESMYRIESNQVAEDVCYRQALVVDKGWLMASRSEQDKFCAAFAKVMAAYHQ
ncbi:MAG: DegT/DnrJ/EryC1/StrS family aminotransferase [Oligosphaeraceae bacterium]|nr:DegT/DnrJ/EryC1/StrS family aminotransferase [Oligosphaeraceae bacterium]